MGDERHLRAAVVVARDFVGPDYTHTISGSVNRNQYRSYFFKVAPGTPALKVDLLDPLTGSARTASSEGQIRFLRFHPYGVGVDSNTSTVCYSPPVPGAPARAADRRVERSAIPCQVSGKSP